MKALTPIQLSAKGESCTFNLQWCNNNPETTVLCHDTRYVQGSPRRCDTRAAFGCSECHIQMDSLAYADMTTHQTGYEWGRAIFKTHVKLMEKGLLTFVGVENKPSKQLPRRDVL